MQGIWAKSVHHWNSDEECQLPAIASIRDFFIRDGELPPPILIYSNRLTLSHLNHWTTFDEILPIREWERTFIAKKDLKCFKQDEFCIKISSSLLKPSHTNYFCSIEVTSRFT